MTVSNFDFLYAWASCGFPLTWKERLKLHIKLKKRLANGATTFYCACCSRFMFVDEATLEHIVPLSWGGTYDWHNLTLTCKKCNCKRGNMHDFWLWRIQRHIKANRQPVPIYNWQP